MAEALKSAALLLGAFAFGYNASNLIHETGHVLGALVGGGQVREVVVHPLSTSFVEVAPDPRPRLTLAAGLALPPAVGLLLLAVLWRRRAARLVPLWVLSSVSLATSGIYLLVGSAAVFGDAADLLALGAPRVALSAIGLALLAAALAVASTTLPLTGIGGDDPIAKRMVLLALAVAPYLSAILTYQLRHDPEAARDWSAMLGAAVAALVGIALGSRYLESRGLAFERRTPSWGDSWVALALGAAAIAVVLQV